MKVGQTKIRPYVEISKVHREDGFVCLFVYFIFIFCDHLKTKSKYPAEKYVIDVLFYL